MTPKNFTALGLAALVSVATAFAVFVSARPWTDGAGQTKTVMLPGLRTNAANVSAIEVTKGAEKVRLADKDGKWVIESSDGYAANPQAVRSLIVAASEAELVERKTAKKDFLKHLGLNEPGGSESAGRLIRFFDKSGGTIAEIVAGSGRHDPMRGATSATYVRRPGEDQAWLANRVLDGSTSMRDWAETKVLNWSTEHIKAAAVEIAGEAPYTIERDGSNKAHKLTGMPAGKKLKYVNSIDDIVEAATLIEFRKVRKAGSGTLPAKAGQVTLENDNGVKVVLEYFGDKDNSWLKIAPSGEGDAKKAADDLAFKTVGWEFDVPQAEFNATLKKLGELLEDAPS